MFAWGIADVEVLQTGTERLINEALAIVCTQGKGTQG